MIETYYYQC